MGPADYLPWLKGHTTTQVLDFWHVTEYIHAAAPAIHIRKSEREAWIDEACHELKHEHGAAGRILAEFKTAALRKLPAKQKKDSKRPSPTSRTTWAG